MNYVALAVLIFALIYGVVMANEGTRNIPLEYGRKGLTDRPERVSNYLPIKISQAGVIPIIFAVSVVLIPSLVAGPLQTTPYPILQNIGAFLIANFSSNSIAYNVLYFLLVIGFTYFYTSVQFNPEEIADDLKKRGGFIPGVRPGKNTTDYLSAVITKITLIGALFLGVIAVFPFIVQNIVGISNFAVGGTSLLIVVSVVLETIRQMESMIVTKNYSSYLD
jgi:preprotein translocase subunit SecY